MQKTMNNNEKYRNHISPEKLSILNDFPGMIFLITQQEVAYANPAATDFLDKKKRKEILLSILFNFIQGKEETTERITLDDLQLELAIIPTHSDSREMLYWIFLHHTSRAQKKLAELTRCHTNLKQHLVSKEKELDKSEKDRKHLADKLHTLEAHLNQTPVDSKMVGSSQALKDLRKMVLQVAHTDATILITGESGTGKELVANFIQESSARSDKPFLKINCNSISESLLESDLFGYEKGAFTGASSQQKGKFEEVNGGTLFLDEIGDISPRMQAALLRVLQNQEIIRVGGNKTIKVDVRIIAATNRNLEEMVSDGSFRLDLFYRLNIINIAIPPLRERKEDIVDLTTHFIRKYRAVFGRKISFLPQPVLDKLLLHNWPGNIRELENVIQRAVLTAKNNVITKEELQFDNLGITFPEDTGISTNSIEPEIDRPLKDTIATVEKKVIRASLEKHCGNVAAVSAELALGKTALYDKMKRYAISAKSFK